MSTDSAVPAADLDLKPEGSVTPDPALPGNLTFRHHNTAILSVTAVDAPIVVTSDSFDEQLAETYDRVGFRPGCSRSVAGIDERRWWPEDVTFADAAAMAGAQAIAESGIDPPGSALLIDTSVCRDHLEPSKAVAVHHSSVWRSACLNFDLSNACLGFVNGMQLAATMIDSGQIEYALIVDGEGSRRTQELTLERLARPETTADGPASQFASLTLGSGGAAMVLGRADPHPEGHRIVGGVARAATEHHKLCVGALDDMRTDTKALLRRGARALRASSGRRPSRTSTGATWTATSPTRSPRCTPRPSPRRSHRPRPWRRAPSRPAATSARGSVPFTLALEAGHARRRRPGPADGHRLGAQRLPPSRSSGDAGLTLPWITARLGLAPPDGPARPRPGVVAPGRRRRRRRGPRTLARPRQRLPDDGPTPSARCCASTATRPGPTCGARLLAAPPAGWRVVAVDQLGMGCSERIGRGAPAGAAGRRPGPARRGARASTGRSSRSPTTGAARSRSAGRWPTATSWPGRAHQHRGAPAGRLAGSGADPAGPDSRRCCGGLRADPHLRARDHRAVSPAAAPAVRGCLRRAVLDPGRRARGRRTSSPTSRSRPTTRRCRP